MIILRVNKNDAAHLYRLLEAREGLANYSTLPHEESCIYRDILLHPSPDLLGTLEEEIVKISQEIPIERLNTLTL